MQYQEETLKKMGECGVGVVKVSLTHIPDPDPWPLLDPLCLLCLDKRMVSLDLEQKVTRKNMKRLRKRVSGECALFVAVFC